MTSPLDWNGKLSVVNGSPLSTPYPRDRLFWAVIDLYDTPQAIEVAYDEQATFWLPAEHGPYFSRQDGEVGCYGADEIVGRTDRQEDAEEARWAAGEGAGGGGVIDLSKIKVGDEVTIRCIVKSVEPADYDGNRPIEVESTDVDPFWPEVGDIVSHVPRLGVGHRVWGLATKERGEVLHAIGDLFWVRFDDARHEIVFADQVERVS